MGGWTLVPAMVLVSPRQRSGPAPRLAAAGAIVLLLAGCIAPGGLSPDPDLSTLFDDDGQGRCSRTSTMPLGTDTFEVSEHDVLRVRYEVTTSHGEVVLEVRDPLGVLVFERTAGADQDATGREEIRTTGKGTWDVNVRCGPGTDVGEVSWDILVEGERLGDEPASAEGGNAAYA